MIEFDLASQQPSANRPSFPVTVIGLGGAGTNILDTIALEGLPGAQLVALNTDARALQSSMLGVKLQLGTELTRGLGTGGDPDLGAEAVRASEHAIREEIQGQKMVFLCTGLGGGTGSGAAPVVARMARAEGAFVVVFAVMPFAFEGRRRLRQAEEALTSLRAEADALVTFDNDRMGEVVLPKKGIHEAFAAADKIVSQSIRAIINLVTAPGLIRIGLDELIAAVGPGDSRCLFGHGSAKGANRVSEALAAALKSPLLHKGELRDKARSVLVHVCGGPHTTFAEVQDLMRELNEGHLHEDTKILFGTGVDPSMGDQLSITLLTSIFPEEVHPSSPAQEPPGSSRAPVAPAPVAVAPAPVAVAPAPVAVAPAPVAVAPAPVAVAPAPVPLDMESADFAIWDEAQTVMVEVEEEEEMAVDETMAAATPSMQESIQFFEEAFAAEEEDHEQGGHPIEAAPRQQRSLQAVEEWVPSHVRQGMTARMQAEAEARVASGLPAFPAPAVPVSRSRAIEPQEDARDQAPTDPAPRRSSLPVRTHVFESWRREQERRSTEARPQQEDNEPVAAVEEPEPAPAPTPTPTPTPAPRSTSRAAASAPAAPVSQRPHPSQPRPHPPQKSRPLMRNRKLSIRHCGQPRRRAGDLTRLSPLLKMAKTLTCPPLCAGNPKA